MASKEDLWLDGHRLMICDSDFFVIDTLANLLLTKLHNTCYYAIFKIYQVDDNLLLFKF
jgi:hypothetical protein